MAEKIVTLGLTAERDLPCQLTLALTGRRIDLAGLKPKPNDVHLFTAASVSWRETSATASAMLSEVRALQATSPPLEDYDGKAIVPALKSLIYSATETFDLYWKTLPDRLEKQRLKPELQAIAAYRGAIKRLRDPVALMCNRMKHEYRAIVSGRIVSQHTGRAAFVYRINVAAQGLQSADPDVHQDEGFASFERTLHEILHGLLLADQLAGELVARLTDTAEDAITLKGPPKLGLAGVLDDLGRRPPLVASSEPERIQGVRTSANNAILTRVKTRKVTEPTIRTVKITVEEAALSAQLFV